ncbi:hypothetical protein [Erythrobacter rubeus]|uniref:Autotransporter domain-containing protein n=1 Tax=Erythrobacter rubeus TaxID=2760803 RepID=A0ABR8KWQ6_9SPHN|nr:hypothetical protein [Erythrobacter rubeus]MBD2842636.1 hypothetical protein [Erythrobacter rubeus]
MTPQNTKRRGSPLAMLMLLVAVWTGGRALIWENPFSIDLPDLVSEAALFADAGTQSAPQPREAENSSVLGELASVSEEIMGSNRYASVLGAYAGFNEDLALASGYRAASAHQMLWLNALGASVGPPAPERAAMYALRTTQKLAGVTPISPPFQEQPRYDRWSVDAWAFWREGSNATLISQGRVPIYGASQLGSNLQYRVAPSSRRDPRLFLRGYRALVNGGETEVAAGGSVRPLASVPVRMAAELRYTENRFGSEVRPAVIAISELPPQSLPVDFTLEAYGGAGYVGGKNATAFADGQAAVTREFASFAGPLDTRARLSAGAGAWGGAQEGASRLDVGPTVRLDMTLGEVPARLSVDWREQVGGDAAPQSGVAATLSTRF